MVCDVHSSIENSDKWQGLGAQFHICWENNPPSGFVESLQLMQVMTHEVPRDQVALIGQE